MSLDVCFFRLQTAYCMRISDWSSCVCSSDLRCLASPRDEHPDERPGKLDTSQEPQPEPVVGIIPAVLDAQACLVRQCVEAGIRVFLAVFNLHGLAIGQVDSGSHPVPPLRSAESHVGEEWCEPL